MRKRILIPYVLIVLSIGAGDAPSWAHHAEQHRLPAAMREIRFDQRLREQVPHDLTFRDEEGNAMRLGDLFGEKPVILTFAYYDCPMLCPLVLEGLLRSLRAVSFTIGEQFTIVTVSIDPDEAPSLAAATKQRYVNAYDRPGAAAGWHFLTGDAAAIEPLTRTVGFRYAYDAAKDDYAHAAGIVILTPQGVVARYLFGIEFAPRDVRLGLIEAADHTIGSPIDQLLLRCYQYDPATGAYGLLTMKFLRLAGVFTVLGLGGLVITMLRR
jgi:protein SCO1/2